MSNQLQITGAAKVRGLEGVLTGTSGIVGALGINVANGIPKLDSNGKILVSQLPSSVMEYKGTWNAATNTPTLANGTGDTGDVYLCNVAGTTNFGAGPITFAVGDQVIYSGSIWQKASGATGTVTSVAMTVPSGLTVTGSPITTSGTLAVSLASGYTIPTTSFLSGLVPYTGATQTVDLGNYDLNARGIKVNGTAGSGHVDFKHQSGTPTGSASSTTMFADTNGNMAWKNDHNYITTLASNANTADRTYTFPDANGTIALTSNLTSYVPYSGAITNVDLGSQDLLTRRLYLNTNNQGIYAKTTGGTLYQILSINTLDKVSIDQNGLGTIFGGTIGNGTYTYTLPSASGTLALTSQLTGGTVTSVTVGTGTTGTDVNANVTTPTTTPLITINIPFASATNTGKLSSTDWTTFNNKQNALTNPVTGTGTSSYHAKFTGTSTIGNSMLTDDGTTLQSIGATRSNLYLKAASSSYYSQLAFTNGTNGSFGGLSYNNSSQYMQFETNSSEWMRLTSTGSLGIGTTSPATLLDVNGLGTLRGMSNSLLSLIGDDTLNSNWGITWKTTTYTGGVAAIRVARRGSTDASDMMFFTSPNGDVPNERMRITSSGNVLIGTTTDSTSGFNKVLTIANDYLPSLELRKVGSIGGARTYNLAVGNTGSFTIYDANAVLDRLTITSSGNVGIGITPSSWYSVYKSLQVGYVSLYNDASVNSYLASNAYVGTDGNFKYTINGALGLSGIEGASWVFYNASSGTAGNTATITERMRIRSTGSITNNNNSVTNQTFSKTAVIDVNGYVDIDTETGGGNFNGILIASNAYIYNAAIRTQAIYTILGRGTTMYTNQIGYTVGSTDSDPFTVTCPSTGIIRIKNTGYNSSSITVTWFGNQS